jgi:hypothetical protein
MLKVRPSLTLLAITVAVIAGGALPGKSDAAPCFGRVCQEWVAIYDPGPGQDTGWSYPNDLILDGAGNLFVAGFARQAVSPGYLDSVVAKYRVDGTLLWASRRPSEYGANLLPRGIALDSSGHIYVAATDSGYSVAPNASTVVWSVFKYDTDGTLMWARTKLPTVQAGSQALDVAVDSYGNAYVIGQLDGALTIAKYDSVGNELWDSSYGTSTSQGKRLAVSLDGAVYGTGYVVGATDFDYLTVKYDSSGSLLWDTQYDGPANKDDIANDIAVDSLGNVHVTGFSVSQPFPVDSGWATIKYDAQGNLVWVSRYEPGLSAEALVVNTAGEVYVTGSGGSAQGAHDYHTVKYDADGGQLWAAVYDDGSDQQGGGALDVALDRRGDVYVTGSIRLLPFPQNDDIATIKYNRYGTEVWAARFSTPLLDTGMSLAVDALGQVYVAGQSNHDVNANTGRATIVKYAQDSDQDGIPDINDNCFAASNASQLDGDGDGVGDACDSCPVNSGAASHQGCPQPVAVGGVTELRVGGSGASGPPSDAPGWPIPAAALACVASVVLAVAMVTRYVRRRPPLEDLVPPTPHT